MDFQDLNITELSHKGTSVNTHILCDSTSGDLKHIVVPHLSLINHYNQHHIEPFLDDPELVFKKPLTEINQVQFNGKDFNFMSDGYRLAISLKDMIEYGDAKIEDFKVDDEEFTLSNGLRMLGEVVGFNDTCLIVRPNMKGFNNLVKKLSYPMSVAQLQNDSIIWRGEPEIFYESVWMKRLSAIDHVAEDHLITCRPVDGKKVYFVKPAG